MIMMLSDNEDGNNYDNNLDSDYIDTNDRDRNTKSKTQHGNFSLMMVKLTMLVRQETDIVTIKERVRENQR